MTAATDTLNCATCPVRERAACAALSAQERNELARIGRRRRVAKGETIFAAGEDIGSYATLISGALKIASFGPDGTERILSPVHPAGLVGEMFAPVAHHDVVALADSELCLFDRSQYEAAVDRFSGPCPRPCCVGRRRNCSKRGPLSSCKRAGHRRGGLRPPFWPWPRRRAIRPVMPRMHSTCR